MTASHRAAGWTAFNGAITQLLSLAVFLITARFVSPIEFGIMAFCFVSIECLRLILSESIGLAITSMDEVSDDDYSAAFWATAVVSVLAAAALFLSAPLLAQAFSNPKLAYALQLTSLIVMTNGITRVHEAWLARRMMFKVFAIRSSVAIICGGSVGIIFALSGFGIDALIAQQLTIAVTGAIIIWFSTPWRPRLQTSFVAIMVIAARAKSVILMQAMNVLNSQSDTFFLSYFVGPASTGSYNAARRLIFAFSAVTSTGKASLPSFAKVQNDQGALGNQFIATLRFTAFFTAPIYFGLAATATDVVQLILGERWSQSAAILSVLAVLAYLTSLTQHAANILLVRARSHWLSMTVFLDAVTNIALFSIVAPYGAFWVAFAYVARGVAFAPIQFILATRLCAVPVTHVLKCLLPATAAAFVMAAVVLAIPHASSTIITLTTKMAAGLVVYTILMAAADWTTTRSSIAKVAVFLRRRQNSG